MLRDRLEERFNDFKKAFKRLKESTEIELKNDIVIDGVIQRFEFTFEQSWKLMKLYLEYEGMEDAKSPRSTIKEAFKYELIDNGNAWINMMIDRNKTSHLYDEETALHIYNSIKSNHVKLLEDLLKKMEEIL